MLLFEKRFNLLQYAADKKLPKVYDLLNVIKNDNSIQVAATDGTTVYVNIDEFNKRDVESEFFILCHELLHILYHHLDKDYYPEDIYQNKELLNMCQDVVINEFLVQRLLYKEPNGLYLDNIAEALYARGLRHTPYLSFGGGQLTTKYLYNYLLGRYDEDSLEQMMQDIGYNSEDDRLQDDRLQDEGNHQQGTKQAIDNVINQLTKALKINPKMLLEENIDKQAGKSNEYSGMVSSRAEVNIISTTEMVNYINSFIGTNAIEKGRNRTYSRPSRRINLSNDMVAAGYKRYKNIKKISIYLDVSGSMDDSLVTTLYKTLKLLYNKVEFDFYTFNGQIAKIDIKNTQEIEVSGGTDITNVLNNIEKEKQDVAIMITDCEDYFSLDNVKSNLMIYTNNFSVKNNNPLVKLTYFQ